MSPFLNNADRGHGSGVAQRTERAAEHAFCEITDHRDVFRGAEARMETVQHLAQPARAFTAGNAPAAGFVRVKMHDAACEVDHAGVFVDYNESTGTKHRASSGD